MTPTMDDVQNQLITLDAASTAMERKWGQARLVRLVSPETRASFRRGWTAWNDAQSVGDYGRMLDIIPKMVKAWRFMDAEATKAGYEPLSPVVWEARAQDGRVVQIVRTAEEAIEIARNSDGRHVLIWTMDEIANLLPQLSLIDTIKREFPGALAERTVQLSRTYAESWAARASDHDFLHGHEEPLFTSPANAVVSEEMADAE